MRTLLLLLFTACHTPVPPDEPAETGDSGHPLERCADPGGRVLAWGADGVWVSDEDGAAFSALTTEVPLGVNTGEGNVVTWSGFTATAWEPGTGAPSAQASFPCEAPARLLDATWVGGHLLGICAEDAEGEILRAEADGGATATGTWASAFQADRGTLYLAEDHGREGWQMAPAEPTDLSRGTEVWADEARGPIYFRSWGEIGNAAGGSYGWAPWAGEPALTTVDLPDGEFVNDLDLLPEGLALVDVITSDWARAARLLDPTGATLGTLEHCDRPRLVCRDGGRVETWCAAPLTRTTWASDGSGWEVVDTAAFPDLDVHSLKVLEPGD